MFRGQASKHGKVPQSRTAYDASVIVHPFAISVEKVFTHFGIHIELDRQPFVMR
jgi:hypothetical protein